VTDGRRVLVTCAAGLNRSGLVTAIAMHILTRHSGITCVQHVQNRRAGALSNRQFRRVLVELR